MSKIDVSKLTNVAKKDGKTVARCPACAARGGDATGNNLVVYDHGKFGCAAFSKDKDHNRMILQLVGVQVAKPEVYRVSVRRITHTPPKVIKIVGRLGRGSSTAPAVEIPKEASDQNTASDASTVADTRPPRPNPEPSVGDALVGAIAPCYLNSTDRLLAEKGYVKEADGTIVDPKRPGLYGFPTAVGWQQV